MSNDESVLRDVKSLSRKLSISAATRGEPITKAEAITQALKTLVPEPDRRSNILTELAIRTLSGAVKETANLGPTAQGELFTATAYINAIIPGRGEALVDSDSDYCTDQMHTDWLKRNNRRAQVQVIRTDRQLGYKDKAVANGLDVDSENTCWREAEKQYSEFLKNIGVDGESDEAEAEADE